MDRTEKIIELIEKLDERLDSIDKTLVKHEANLAEHMRRTELLENDLKPIKAHVHKLNGGLIALSVIATVVGIAAGIYKIVS